MLVAVVVEEATLHRTIPIATAAVTAVVAAV
jgi:hypothetical protein